MYPTWAHGAIPVYIKVILNFVLLQEQNPEGLVSVLWIQTLGRQHVSSISKKMVLTDPRQYLEQV